MATHKSSRRVKCKLCNFVGTRDELVTHVDTEHQDLIPKSHTAEQLVYDWINKTNGHGKCMVCLKDTKWSEKLGKYEKTCGSESCNKKLREKAENNNIRLYGVPNLLNSEEQQQKMLAARSISGTYNFKGVKKTYTGNNERKLLEFADKVLDTNPYDWVMPGPVLEYEFKGVTHKWITDALYIPYNLIIEVKDGGSNPNTRPMEEYRAKQLSKEEMITNLGTYNYLRLTDNQFGQLLEAFADIRMNMVDYSKTTPQNTKMSIKINEVSAANNALPSLTATQNIQVVNYMMGDCIAVTDNIYSKNYVTIQDGKLKITPKSELPEFGKVYGVSVDKECYYEFLLDVKQGKECTLNEMFMRLFKTGYLNEEQLDYDSKFKPIIDTP